MFKIVLTEGLFGNPTLWPQVFNKVTKRSRTVDCKKKNYYKILILDQIKGQSKYNESNVLLLSSF